MVLKTGIGDLITETPSYMTLQSESMFPIRWHHDGGEKKMFIIRRIRKIQFIGVNHWRFIMLFSQPLRAELRAQCDFMLIADWPINIALMSPSSSSSPSQSKCSFVTSLVRGLKPL